MQGENVESRMSKAKCFAVAQKEEKEKIKNKLKELVLNIILFSQTLI
jgi:hypothetical protein